MTRKLDVVNFLRGYSITTIVLMHLVQGYGLPGWAFKATSFGGAGVHVFILCSGFGLYLSYLNKPLGYKAFLRKREFGIRSLCDKPAFVNDVNIHRRFLGQEVVRNESGNQV